MAQLFHHSANSIAKLSVIGVLLLGAVATMGASGFFYSQYVTRVDEQRAQPVQFSHKHHVAGLGIDCRYCHTSVENHAFAGIPPTRTCMTCHSQVWTNAEILEPVRESWRTGEPLQWNRVHDLADFAYFNHGIHVQKGIGCTTCHGPIDAMNLTFKSATLYMEWCLQCHRNPEKFIRPKDQVFATDYVPPADQEELGRRLVKEYNIPSTELLTACSTCHR
jgi:hypothetical protein